MLMTQKCVLWNILFLFKVKKLPLEHTVTERTTALQIGHELSTDFTTFATTCHSKSVRGFVWTIRTATPTFV
jgi:hypothetical protein